MAVKEFNLTKDFLQNIFEYKDGELYWKNHKRFKGQIAGAKRNDGYKLINIKIAHNTTQRVLAHRIIFLMHHGYMPEVVDHIDRNRSNNRIENLRECSFQENLWNQSVRKKTKSGYKGVYWNNQMKKWVVYIAVNKKLKYFGCSEDVNEAAKMADSARKQHRGKFS